VDDDSAFESVPTYAVLPPRQGRRGAAAGKRRRQPEGDAAAASSTGSADDLYALVPCSAERTADVEAPSSAAAAAAAAVGSSLGPGWTKVLAASAAHATGPHAPVHGAEAGEEEEAPVWLEQSVSVLAFRGGNKAGRIGVLQDGLWHTPQGAAIPGLQTDADAIGASADFSEQWPLHVLLSNGHEYACDFVISATGVLPSTGMINDPAFLKHTDSGLVVNNKMQTTGSADIYAAGDAATVLWPRTQVLSSPAGSLPLSDPGVQVPLWFQMRLWNQARQEGMFAARSMARKLDPLEEDGGMLFEIFAHATHFMGFKVILLGLFNGQGLGDAYETAVKTTLITTDGVQRTMHPASLVPSAALAHASPSSLDSSGPVQVQVRVTPGVEYIKVLLLHGRVVGAMLIGETDLEETMENLILNRLDLATSGRVLDLLDPHMDTEDFFD
jgi:hypothetical protein